MVLLPPFFDNSKDLISAADILGRLIYNVVDSVSWPALSLLLLNSSVCDSLDMLRVGEWK